MKETTFASMRIYWYLPLPVCQHSGVLVRWCADVLVAGSAVFKGGSVGKPEVYGQNIRAIRAAAQSAQ